MSTTLERLEKNTNTALIVYKSKDKPKKWGGARPGAGHPKGKKQKRTIEKLKVKQELEDRIAKHAQKLLTAQLTVAIGTQYLFTRHLLETPKGKRWSKFERVEDPDIMRQYLDGELKSIKDEYYMLTAEKPDVHTIEAMFDRAFGRAPQNLNIKDDRPDPIATILARFGLLEEERDSNAGKTTNSEGSPPQSTT